MSKALGSEPLGKFYTKGKTGKRREWRGFRDTWYDYTQWLKIWKVLLKFMLNNSNFPPEIRA